jgi:hypothetical protein
MSFFFFSDSTSIIGLDVICCSYKSYLPLKSGFKNERMWHDTNFLLFTAVAPHSDRLMH